MRYRMISKNRKERLWVFGVGFTFDSTVTLMSSNGISPVLCIYGKPSVRITIGEFSKDQIQSFVDIDLGRNNSF